MPETGLKGDGDPAGHGSCMVAQVAGRLCGIAKKTKITMVKTRSLSGAEGIEACIDSLVKTYDEIKTNQVKHGAHQAVVSMSWAFVDNQAQEEHNPAVAALIKLIYQLSKLNVVCVTAAGSGEPVCRPEMFLIYWYYANGLGHTHTCLPCGPWSHTAGLDSCWGG